MKIGISGASSQLTQAVLAELVQRRAGQRIAGISLRLSGTKPKAFRDVLAAMSSQDATA